MENLRLRAEDIEDITILSAYLQDAITMMGDIAYLRESRKFVMMLNRYVWENRCPETGDILADRRDGDNMACGRIRTGLHFDDVTKVTSQNIIKSRQDQPMELLSIEAHKTEEENFMVDFVFAGNGIIRLECEMISAHMQDIGVPWPAKCHPKHEILEVLKGGK